MIESKDLDKRHLLPRWSMLSSARNAGEFTTPARNKPSVVRLEAARQTGASLQKEFERRKSAWEALPDTFTAEELVSTAIVSGKTEDGAVESAARKILSDDDASNTVKSFAANLLDGSSSRAVDGFLTEAATIYTAISRRKRLINVNPRDALLLTETALLHANIGQNTSSEKLLRRALNLAPTNRYVLRSTARYLCHTRKHDEALNLLSKSQRSAFDPWICSAELAIAAVVGKRMGSLKNAFKMVLGGDFSARDKSELAAELATLEFNNGNRKKGTKTIALSANDPSENTVAQIEFLIRKSYISQAQFEIDISRSMEAEASHAYASENMEDALRSCEEWQSIEPFSIRPAIFGTFLSTTDRSKLNSGIEIGKRGLLSNPDDNTLLNNMAVISAYAGDIDKARVFAAKSRARGGEEAAVMNLATDGLIMFRSGNYVEATKNYEKAIRMAVDKSAYQQALRAYCFFAREVADIEPSVSHSFASEILEICDRLKSNGLELPNDISLLQRELANKDPNCSTKGLNFRPFGSDLLFNSA